MESIVVSLRRQPLSTPLTTYDSALGLERAQGRKAQVIVFMNSFVELSGGDIRCIELTRAFVEKRYEVTVITTELGRRLFEDRGLRGLKFILTSEGRESTSSEVLASYIWRTLVALALSIRLYPRSQDRKLLLFSSSDFLPDVLPAYLFKLFNPSSTWLASVYHLIPRLSERNAGSPLSFLGQRASFLLIGNQSDLVQTETELVGGWLKDNLRMPASRIVAVGSGIDMSAADRVGPKERIYDACFLARLSPTKGVDDIVRAWRLVCQTHKYAHLAIAGAGSDDSVTNLRLLINELGLARNVIVIGFISEEDKYSLLKSSKIYVLPSYEEGIPITFSEAMYCGTPVVAYYLPTYTTLKEYLLTVEKGDIAGLANTIRVLLDDESIIRRYKAAAKEWVAKNSWESVAAQVLSKLECH